MDELRALKQFFEDNQHAMIATRPGGPKILGGMGIWEVWYKSQAYGVYNDLALALAKATEMDA
jgi:hypothetical protein